MAIGVSWFSFKAKLLKPFLLLWFLCSSSADKILQSFTGTLGPGNYSYFSLHEKGEITLLVESIVGDADIYVSEKVLKPTYLEYDIKSITYGVDTIIIPKLFKRPVGIAIYGHPFSLLTNFKITAVQDYTGDELATGMEGGYDYNEDEDRENEYSLKNIIWALIVGILKIVLEVLV